MLFTFGKILSQIDSNTNYKYVFRLQLKKINQFQSFLTPFHTKNLRIENSKHTVRITLKISCLSK